MAIKIIPLAERMRPDCLEDFVGQPEITGSDKLLQKALTAGRLPSLIFWGPPGTGKTTLALIIAKQLKADFIRFSAVTEGVKDLRKVIDTARSNQLLDKNTLLFIDEIHRWNKAQQDALLPHLEDGTIILIGATTENPSFEIRSALLSRVRVIVLKHLTSADIKLIVVRAATDLKKGLGAMGLTFGAGALELLCDLSGGDARTAMNILETCALLNPIIDLEVVKEAAQKVSLQYDKDGENHYNLISALHKSMRGSDANATLYWLARMLEAGEDPMYIARRLVRFASEDVGLANSQALNQAVAAYNAARFIGLPECKLNLAQAAVYLAKCQKSNALYAAYNQAAEDTRTTGNVGVPLHLRNAPTSLMKELGYGADYQYSPDFDYQEKQEYLPEELKGRKYLPETTK
ncbi:AAA family ATPase [Candidatus Falkowbacteria bacterium CG10_big_fil_rev_8_21_14_0_10_37_14]|uniref:AAA family ATPase n=1 Tax=Candidatus Falkowbacteria bacterium CG10_big_fil_rev_8_21_14_0_10_37_14 TaxID=1974561 RepID=A0A2M6WUB1_9BACT|nr:replication-associated recombination protein A [Candidatus Falkowbacteria bacterium]PIT96379.1 MAG: AAA family ATPase [Candidatus Falkowbacteria bacterium CG10_big_fil_rev_8_21_14_0_10_37_14]